MTKSKHTPGPWTWEKNPRTSHTFNVIYDGIRISEVLSGPAEFTTPIYGCPEFIATQGEANAEFIVRACNSHYELLEALDYIVWTHEMNGNGASNCVARLGPQCLGKARAAIAKARGETK